MKLWKLALCATAATFGFAGAALADDSPTIAFNVGVTNEYSFRGLSQTRKDMQVFGGADVTMGKFYAGTWASNIDFGAGTPDAEIDIYGGVKPTVGPVSLDLGVIGYLYAGAPATPVGSFNYVEFKAAASVPVGPATVGVAVYYSPEFPLDFGKATYIEGNVSIPLASKLTLSGAVGYQDLDEAKWGLNGYTTANAGLTYAFNSHFSIDGRVIVNSGSAHDYFGTNRNTPFNARDKVVVTLKAAF